MNEIAIAVRALRDAFRHAKVPYDCTGYFNIALTDKQIRAIKAESEFAEFADQETADFVYFEGFRIGHLERYYP